MAIHIWHRTLPENHAEMAAANGGDWSRRPMDMYGDTGHVLNFARGKVVSTGERNYHDDSDFYAVYQAPDGSFQTCEYATTRAWTYNNAALVDATPDVVAAWKAYQARIIRTAAVQLKLTERKIIRDLSAETGVSVVILRKIVKAFTGMTTTVAGWGRYQPRSTEKVHTILFDMIHAVHGPRKTRSGFKRSIVEQVLAWANDPAPRYARPLSDKQIQHLSW